MNTNNLPPIINNLPSINFIINEIIEIINMNYNFDINYHFKTINYIHKITYNHILNYVSLFLDNNQKIKVIYDLYPDNIKMIYNKINVLDKKCAFIISHYVYFDIYLQLKNLIKDEVSLCF